MIVRLTYCKFIPDSVEQAKSIYNGEIVPVPEPATLLLTGTALLAVLSIRYKRGRR